MNLDPGGAWGYFESESHQIMRMRKERHVSREWGRLEAPKDISLQLAKNFGFYQRGIYERGSGIISQKEE